MPLAIINVPYQRDFIRARSLFIRFLFNRRIEGKKREATAETAELCFKRRGRRELQGTLASIGETTAGDS
jgi:hypothetical protein